MHTIELTEEELTLVRAALRSYLDDFGHEEADVLRRPQGDPRQAALRRRLVAILETRADPAAL